MYTDTTFELTTTAMHTVHVYTLVKHRGDSPDVGTALLKFLQEFVQNKAQRLVFDQSSPNGILLFRETSKVVCAYGNRLVASPAFRSAVAAGAAAAAAGAGLGSLSGMTVYILCTYYVYV